MQHLITKYNSPLYVYYENNIVDNINSLKNHIGSVQTEYFYAMKANSNLAILRTIKEQGCGIDCVSIGEMKTALKVGLPPKKIRFTPTFAGEEEILFAFEHQIQVSLDTMYWVHWALKNHPHIPIGLRINPSVMAGAYLKTSTGHAKAKFGIGLQYIPEIIDLIQNHHLLVTGLHIHSGSDILEATQFLDAVEVLLVEAKKFPSLEYLDLGSGFKVSYFEGDTTTDMADLGKQIKQRMSRFFEEYGRNLQLIFEPGKYIVSNAGRFLVTCTGLKENGGIHFAGVDSGFNHLIRPMFYGAYHTIKNISNPEGPLKKYDVVGNICETDTFASDREITEIRVGDILCFENAGAYCYSMSSHYNSRPRPAEVYIKANGDVQLIRKRETLEDIWVMQET